MNQERNPLLATKMLAGTASSPSSIGIGNVKVIPIETWMASIVNKAHFGKGLGLNIFQQGR